MKMADREENTKRWQRRSNRVLFSSSISFDIKFGSTKTEGDVEHNKTQIKMHISIASKRMRRKISKIFGFFPIHTFI